jgi:hypothetical protein
LWKLPPPLDKTGDWIARLETVLIGEYCTGWKVWKEVMSWCWGKEVTKLDSWSGLRGSDPVIDRRIVAELMTNVMIRGVKKREAQVHQISLSEALKLTWAAVLTSCLSILAKWRGTPVQLKKRTPKGTYPEILSAITHSMKPCSCGISLMLRILDVGRRLSLAPAYFQILVKAMALSQLRTRAKRWRWRISRLYASATLLILLFLALEECFNLGLCLVSHPTTCDSLDREVQKY